MNRSELSQLKIVARELGIDVGDNASVQYLIQAIFLEVLNLKNRTKYYA